MKLLEFCKILSKPTFEVSSEAKQYGLDLMEDSYLNKEVLFKLAEIFAPELCQEIKLYGIPKSAMSITEEEADELFENFSLTDRRIIGKVTATDDGLLAMDLRNPLFTKIEDEEHPSRKYLIVLPNNLNLKVGEYYSIKCKILNKDPYVFVFDDSAPPILLQPRKIVDLLNQKNNPKEYTDRKRTKRQLKTLETQLTGCGSDIFIYELLQNANDYPVITNENGEVIKKKVDVQFRLTNEHFIFEHTGDVFNAGNIAAICDISAEEKSENKDAIGYKGIGFKTVFRSNRYVYLQTGPYSFCFDEQSSSKTIPWQITPIWVNESDIDVKIKSLFAQPDQQDYRVKFAMIPRDLNFLVDETTPNNFVTLFKDVFKTERVMLFIKNLNSVSIYFDGNGSEPIYKIKDASRWIIYDEEVSEDNISPDLTRKINIVLTDSSDLSDEEKYEKGNLLDKYNYDRIPPKYKDFKRTAVKFACHRNGNIIIPVQDDEPYVYCYLPAKNVSFGFPFLINTDMIPTGDRTNIEPLEINYEIAKLAGVQFLDWVKKLLNSSEYDSASVFTLIPSFENCKTLHTTYISFIERFQESFEQKIHKVEFIPCVENGEVCYSNVDNVLYDSTRLLDSGILTDTQFIDFIGHACKKLPSTELRNSSHFQSFQNTYHSTTNMVSWSHVESMVEKEVARTWLKVQENNDKFINFLLKEKQLKKLCSKKIFLGNDGELYSISQIYYDVDKYLVDLKVFEDKMKYLSTTTRDLLKDNEYAEQLMGTFKKFKCGEFVDDLLSAANKEETIGRLKNEDASIKFYNFLAKNVPYKEIFRSLPFFNDNHVVVDSFNDIYIFISSKVGKDLCSQQWMSNFAIQFVSSSYEPKTIEYFKNHFAVKEFSDQLILDTFIKKEENRKLINVAINNNFNASKVFIDYCYKHKDSLKPTKLTQIALKCVNYINEESWFVPNNNVFFKESFDEKYAGKTWLDAEWLGTLDMSYFNTEDEGNDVIFKKFIEDKFNIGTLTEEVFYKNVVQSHLSCIFKNISGENDKDHVKNKEFIKYLDAHSALIFDTCRDVYKYKDLTLLSYCGTTEFCITPTTYLFDSDLETIATCDWMPKELFTMCHSSYGNSEAIKKMGGKQYNISDFFKHIIEPQIITSINKYITEKKQSVGFHTYMSSHTANIASNDLNRMQRAKIYLQDNQQPVATSTGHKILTKKAQELVDKQLVELADLNIIDNDYNAIGNTTYWEDVLGNKKFQISDFYNWLKLETNKAKVIEKLKDKAKNIDFWRWVKNNNPNDYTVLKDLPLFLKLGSIDKVGSLIYLSDEYNAGAKIETLLMDFDPSALILSSEYMSVEDEYEGWVLFWKNVGLQSNILNVLVCTIIPGLENLNKD